MTTVTADDGAEIYFKDWRDGPVITFSHGWPLDADAWNGQVLFLARHSLSLRGHRSLRTPTLDPDVVPTRHRQLRGLIYESEAFEGQFRDYEFGLLAMREHWRNGLDDIRRTLAGPSRLQRRAPEVGVVTHDVYLEE